MLRGGNIRMCSCHTKMEISPVRAEALAGDACSADVVLNILARRRQPAPPTPIPTPADLRPRLEPTADCHRYDLLKEAPHGAP